MKLWILASSVVLSFQIAGNPVQQQRPKASVEGIVIRAGTGQPLAGSRVTLTRGRGGPGGPLNAPQVGIPPGAPGAAGTALPFPPGARGGPGAPDPIPSGVTDERGRFVIQGLDEGGYALQVQANGYVPQNYGQRYAGGPGTPITLAAGQEVKDIAVSLTPAGNISGRITDRSDRPLVNVPVQLLRYSYNANGQRAYQAAGAVRTNDRGEYRIYWVTPGRYYLMAGRAAAATDPILAMMASAAGIAGTGNEVPVSLGYAFYPGVADIATARAIDLQPGAEIQSIDMALTVKPPTYRIRGRLIDSRTGQPPARASVSAVAQTPGLTSNSYDMMMMMEGTPSRNYNAATGTIEIPDLLPGTYAVTATVQDPAPSVAPGGGGGPGQRPGQSIGTTTVVVSDSDVEGMVITVVPAAAIPARIRVDGAQAPFTLRIQLISGNPNSSNPAAPSVVSSAVSATPNADTTFRLENVPPGSYRVAVAGQATGGNRGGAVFIKEARFEGADVLNAPLQFSGSVSGTLDILAGIGSGQVNGIVTDARAQPAPVTQVVLVPERARSRADLYRTATTDENGRFVISSIMPGEYKVFSWQALEPFGWFDPDLLAQSETKGRAVRVSESSAETIDVRIIPAGGGQ